MSAPAEPRPPLEELRLKNLLLAYDGSGSAELALTAAVTAARRDRARITVLVVVPDVSGTPGVWMAGGVDPRRLQEDADREAQQTLREVVDRIPDDIPVTTRLRHGRPGPEIVAEAQEGSYDGILLGARGVGRVGALVGSVSGYVLHHAGTPVFVAHDPRAS